MGFFSNLFGDDDDKSELPLVTLSGSGNYRIDAVGESHYQDELEDICGGKTSDGHQMVVDAILIHDDDNQYDDQAIAVTIRGVLVGYFSRDNARQFRSNLADGGFPGHPATCKAKIVGGWSRGGDEGDFGVKIDLA